MWNRRVKERPCPAAPPSPPPPAPRFLYSMSAAYNDYSNCVWRQRVATLSTLKLEVAEGAGDFSVFFFFFVFRIRIVINSRVTLGGQPSHVNGLCLMCKWMTTSLPPSLSNTLNTQYNQSYQMEECLCHVWAGFICCCKVAKLHLEKSYEWVTVCVCVVREPQK